jgi:hypothetical protein
MHTPAKGSPVRWRTSRMSPTRAHSGLSFAKRRVRAFEGSRKAVWEAVTAATALGQIFLILGDLGSKMGMPWYWPGGVV